MEDIFLIEIPIFKPKYKKWKKYGYKNSIEKENLKSVLEECSNGYCMYCYTRIRIDGKFYANLEHAIEKNNSKKLVECVPNIGLACSVCNQSLKKRGENNRRLSQKIISDYESASLCSTTKRKQCTVPCQVHAYPDLKTEYCHPYISVSPHPAFHMIYLFQSCRTRHLQAALSSYPYHMQAPLLFPFPLHTLSAVYEDNHAIAHMEYCP